MIDTIEKGIHIEKPSPLNLEYRKKVSFLKDEFTIKYLNKFTDDMKYRFKTKIIEMTDEELILFAVKFLGEDKNYQYFYIYDDDVIIGEIYTYLCFDDVDYFFYIYISEEYRTQENMIKAILKFESQMYDFQRENVRKLFIDTDFLDLDDILIKCNFKLNATFHDNTKRYVCKEYMYRKMYLEKPTLEHEEKFKKYLKKDNSFDYKKWLKNIETESKKRKDFFLMFYNDYLETTEIVGVGHVLNNWKKNDCISYEVDFDRRQTDFGKFFLEMLFDELDENAEFITLSCEDNDKFKLKEYNEVFKYLRPNIYHKNGKTYYEIILIVY